MPKEKVIKKSARSKKQDDKKLFAFLAVFLSILGFIIALLVKKEEKYVMFYAKQSLGLFLACIVAGASAIIPIIGVIIMPILYIIILILWIIALVNSLSGKMIDTPLIGEYADRVEL